MGVPLINTLYEDDPNVGLYTLPLLIWYPLTVVVGTMLAPMINVYVDRHENRRIADSESFPAEIVYREMDDVSKPAFPNSFEVV